MTASSKSNDGALLTDINVTPLVDVVLVLLVIMMAAATALASRTIPVQLPKASTGSASAVERPLAVGVDESGAIFVEQQRVGDDELRARARGVEPTSASSRYLFAPVNVNVNVPVPVTDPPPPHPSPPSPTTEPTTEPAAAPAPPPPPVSASAIPAVTKPAPTTSANDPHANLFAEAHRIHFAEKDPARAIGAWDRYLDAAPNGRFAPEARYNRALALVRVGRHVEAKQELEAFSNGAFGDYRRDEARALLGALARDE